MIKKGSLLFFLSVCFLGQAQMNNLLHLNTHSKDAWLLNNKKHDTPVNEGDEWTNLLNNRIGTLYGRRGTSINTPVGEINIYLSEESYLIGKHQPIMCKDRSRYK